MAHRDAQVTIIIGRNGTGKSTFCKEIIDGIKGRALVCTYNGAPNIWRKYKEVNIKKSDSMRFKKGIRQVIAGRYEISRNQNDTFKYIYKNNLFLMIILYMNMYRVSKIYCQQSEAIVHLKQARPMLLLVSIHMYMSNCFTLKTS